MRRLARSGHPDTARLLSAIDEAPVRLSYLRAMVVPWVDGDPVCCVRFVSDTVSNCSSHDEIDGVLRVLALALQNVTVQAAEDLWCSMDHQAATPLLPLIASALAVASATGLAQERDWAAELTAVARTDMLAMIERVGPGRWVETPHAALCGFDAVGVAELEAVSPKRLTRGLRLHSVKVLAGLPRPPIERIAALLDLIDTSDQLAADVRMPESVRDALGRRGDDALIADIEGRGSQRSVLPLLGQMASASKSSASIDPILVAADSCKPEDPLTAAQGWAYFALGAAPLNPRAAAGVLVRICDLLEASGHDQNAAQILNPLMYELAPSEVPESPGLAAGWDGYPMAQHGAAFSPRALFGVMRWLGQRSADLNHDELRTGTSRLAAWATAGFDVGLRARGGLDRQFSSRAGEAAAEAFQLTTAAVAGPLESAAELVRRAHDAAQRVRSSLLREWAEAEITEAELRLGLISDSDAGDRADLSRYDRALALVQIARSAAHAADFVTSGDGEKLRDTCAALEIIPEQHRGAASCSVLDRVGAWRLASASRSHLAAPATTPFAKAPNEPEATELNRRLAVISNELSMMTPDPTDLNLEVARAAASACWTS